MYCSQVIREILDARELKASAQREAIEANECAVIGLGVNIPGASKRDAWIVRFLFYGEAALRRKLARSQMETNVSRFYLTKGGCFCIIPVQADARVLKSICVEFEEETSYHRLFDVDVIDKHNAPVGRSALRLPPRKCFCCDKDAVLCVRSRSHTDNEVNDKVQQMKTAFLCELNQSLLPDNLAVRACGSMVDEVFLTPKPGLVDTENSGAHDDMDLDTFMRSIGALFPHFCNLAKIGAMYSDMDTVIKKAKTEGILCEQDMFAATCGINTHKGAIFAVGWCLVAVTFSLQNGRDLLHAVPEFLREVGCREVETALMNISKPVEDLTHGEQLFLSTQCMGIRGELQSGMPSVFRVGLPAWKRHADCTEQCRNLAVLFAIISQLEDTTILSRGGRSALHEAQAAAKRLYRLSRSPDFLSQVSKADREWSEKHISPGGAADLLSVTLFLAELNR